MNTPIEKRKNIRNILKVPIIVKELETGSIYRGRMTNYSASGICLETDGGLDLNVALFVRFESPPYSASADPSSRTLENLFAKIRWKEETRANFFSFRYGASILSAESEINLNRNKFRMIKDFRKHPRKPYSKTVYFTTENQYFEGSITDISKEGMFFNTQDSFSVGQIIRLVIPGTKIDNGIMLKAEVVRFNEKGVGVKFNGLMKGNMTQASTHS